MTERRFVKRILPYRKADRFPFTVTLPGDAALVTGIQVVCSPGATAIGTLLATFPHSRTAGHLSLRWQGKGDIFFQAAADLPFQYDHGYSLAGIPNNFGIMNQGQAFHNAGARMEGFPVEIPRHRTLAGFYRDELNRLAQTDEPYGIDITFTYRTA